MSSSSFGLFKRPRSKSEKQVRPPRTVFGDFSTAYTSIAGSSTKLPSAALPDLADNAEAGVNTALESQDPTSLLSTVSDSHGRHVGSDLAGLPLAHDLFQPGSSSPTGLHSQISPLQSSPPPVSTRLPPAPPPISPSEIGTKFPTSTYGPGVDRRVLHNPDIRSPRSPPENTVTEAGRHAHRRSSSMTDLTLLYHDHPSPLNLSRSVGLAHSPNLPFDSSPVESDFASRRNFGPQHSEQTRVGFPPSLPPEPQTEQEQYRAFSNVGSEDWVEDLLPPNILLESREQNSRGYLEDLRSDVRNSRSNGGTNANEAYRNLDTYEQVGQHVSDEHFLHESDQKVEHDASSLYDIQPNRPRHSSGTSSLAKYMWSPRGSLDTGSVFSADVGAQSYVHSSTTQGLAGPPSAPLPQLPSQGIQNIDRRAHRDISTTTGQYSHSSESYGNTRNLLGLPESRIPSDQNSARSFARLSITDLEGSVHSRSLSEFETRELENDIRALLQPIGETNMLEEHTHNRDRYKHGHHHAGSLSISYLRNESQAGEAGPGSSQGSSSFGLEKHAPREDLDLREASSGREGRLGFHDDSRSPSRVRSGTPPLLFGRRALVSNDLMFPEPVPSGVRSNGRLAQALAAAGLRGNSRLTEAVAGDEDGDWETETGSGAFSRQFVREAMAQGETGSSYADNSDSGSLSQSKVIKTSSAEHVVQYSPHARYSQNWTLLQDQESGNMVLAPDPQSLTSAAATRSPYHHPSPLSKEHTHPFKSSPPLRKSAEVSPLFDKSSRFEARSALSHQSEGREKVTDENYHEEPPLSCAMLSDFGTGTMNDGSRDEVFSRRADRKGRSYPSSAWLSTVDGDALSDHSDLSSGVGSFSKVITLGAKANMTGTPEGSGARQVGSSLADASSPTVESSPFVQHTPRTQNSSRKQTSHRDQSSRLNQSSPDLLNLGEASNPRTASAEVRRHREDLVGHSLLLSLPEPSATEPRRLSVPLELLTRGSSTMDTKPPNTVGMRVGGSMPQFIANSSGHQVSERSPRRQASTGDLAVDVGFDEDQQIRAPALSPLRRDKLNRTRSESTKGSVAATETGQAQTQADPDYPGGLPYDSMYGDFIREMRSEPAIRAMRPPMRQRQYNRPIAQAEPPHLYRVPRLTIDEALARQKELSRAYLRGLVIAFPLLLLFGHGLLDGVMAWHTSGEVATFRDEEKVVALWVGYGTFAGVFAGLCVLLALLL